MFYLCELTDRHIAKKLGTDVNVTGITLSQEQVRTTDFNVCNLMYWHLSYRLRGLNKFLRSESSTIQSFLWWMLWICPSRTIHLMSCGLANLENTCLTRNGAWVATWFQFLILNFTIAILTKWFASWNLVGGLSLRPGASEMTVLFLSALRCAPYISAVFCRHHTALGEKSLRFSVFGVDTPILCIHQVLLSDFGFLSLIIYLFSGLMSTCFRSHGRWIMSARQIGPAQQFQAGVILYTLA